MFAVYDLTYIDEILAPKDGADQIGRALAWFLLTNTETDAAVDEWRLAFDSMVDSSALVAELPQTPAGPNPAACPSHRR